MYKSRLQVLVQRRGWDLPEYSTKKDGPDHMPSFTATVKVKDYVFQTPAQCKSAKEAQNTVAQIAFENLKAPATPRPVRRTPVPTVHSPLVPPPEVNSSHTVHSPPVRTVPPPEVASSPPVRMAPPPEVNSSPPVPVSPDPSSLPIPPPGLLAKKNDTNKEVLQHNVEDAQASMVYRTSIGSHDKSYKDTLHMYKNRLQQHAQKKDLGFPVYACEAGGPPHARRFRARVSVDGKVYEALELFTTLKDAEQAAAKVACEGLSVDAIEEGGGLYKNLLQEFSQKKGLLCPKYETTSFGLSHMPSFVSTVVIGTDAFRGAEARSKKQAEMNAAKVAYCALMGITDKLADTKSSRVPSINESAVSDNLTQIIQPTSVIKQPQDVTNEDDSIKGHEEAQTKFAPDNMTVDASPPVPLDRESSNDNLSPVSSPLKHSDIAVSNTAVAEQPVENQALPRRKIIVYPRNSRLPIPEGATVLPCSDDKWVAYKVEIQQEPTA